MPSRTEPSISRLQTVTIPIVVILAVLTYVIVSSQTVLLTYGTVFAIGTLVVAAVFGFVCVRYTRIFFGILTLALSQVLWSLAFKFFWVSGGTDGLRVPT